MGDPPIKNVSKALYHVEAKRATIREKNRAPGRGEGRGRHWQGADRHKAGAEGIIMSVGVPALGGPDKGICGQRGEANE